MRSAGLCGAFVLISSVALADEFNSSSGEAARVLIQSEPSGSGGVSPRCLGSVNPFAFDDPNGFAKFLRNCLEQPAYAILRPSNSRPAGVTSTQPARRLSTPESPSGPLGPRPSRLRSQLPSVVRGREQTTSDLSRSAG
jgi:hypothetical protein